MNRMAMCASAPSSGGRRNGADVVGTVRAVCLMMLRFSGLCVREA